MGISCREQKCKWKISIGNSVTFDPIILFMCFYTFIFWLLDNSHSYKIIITRIWQSPIEHNDFRHRSYAKCAICFPISQIVEERFNPEIQPIDKIHFHLCASVSDNINLLSSLFGPMNFSQRIKAHRINATHRIV